MIQTVSFPGSTGSRFYTGILWEFGAQLRQMRRKRGFSEAELAGHLGTTRAHVQDMEEGRAEIDLALLAALAGALGVTMAALVDLL